MNPRKKFSQMSAVERSQFLNDLSAEMTHPSFNPVKKAILEKVAEYVNSANKLNPERCETCDIIFNARNFAAVPFLEVTIRALEQISDIDSKLRNSVLEEAIKRRTVILERESNMTSAASVAIIASSVLTSSWFSAGLLLTIGVALFKYSDGFTQVRAAQALDEQIKKPLLGNQMDRLDNNFGDTIESGVTIAKTKAVSFFHHGTQIANDSFQFARTKLGF